MSVYDTIYFDCPQCGEELYTQSKAGKCSLVDYYGEEVPPEIAYDIQGDKIWCDKCEQAYCVLTDPIPPPVTIKCKLVKDQRSPA